MPSFQQKIIKHAEKPEMMVHTQKTKGEGSGKQQEKNRSSHTRAPQQVTRSDVIKGHGGQKAVDNIFNVLEE